MNRFYRYDVPADTLGCVSMRTSGCHTAWKTPGYLCYELANLKELGIGPGDRGRSRDLI